MRLTFKSFCTASTTAPSTSRSKATGGLHHGAKPRVVYITEQSHGWSTSRSKAMGGLHHGAKPWVVYITERSHGWSTSQSEAMGGLHHGAKPWVVYIMKQSHGWSTSWTETTGSCRIKTKMMRDLWLFHKSWSFNVTTNHEWNKTVLLSALVAGIGFDMYVHFFLFTMQHLTAQSI